MPHEILGPVAPLTLIYPEYLPPGVRHTSHPLPPYLSLLHGTRELSLSGQGNPKPPHPPPCTLPISADQDHWSEAERRGTSLTLAYLTRMRCTDRAAHGTAVQMYCNIMCMYVCDYYY